MSTATQTHFAFRETVLAQLISDTARSSPALWRNALLLLVGFAICLALPLVDDRLFNGISTWHKPAKFFFSLAVQFFTVAWALSLVEASMRQRRIIRWSVLAMIAAAWLEMAYIIFRAARAEASHYNLVTALDRALYSLMGLGAVTLTATAALIGFVIWLNRNGNLWRTSAGIGLVLGNVLTTAVAFPLAAGTGHWIGGDLTDATGLPVFFWSTTGGDLRVAHFTALHIAQIVPFAALSGRISVVYVTAIVMTVVTAAVFVQAMMGVPLFRL